MGLGTPSEAADLLQTKFQASIHSGTIKSNQILLSAGEKNEFLLLQRSAED